MFRKGRRKELHLFRSDINPLPFLVIYAVELGMNSHFREGTGFVRPNLFFDEPFCLGTYRMVRQKGIPYQQNIIKALRQLAQYLTYDTCAALPLQVHCQRLPSKQPSFSQMPSTIRPTPSCVTPHLHSLCSGAAVT